jgi:AraC-like DNA-binding protein
MEFQLDTTNVLCFYTDISIVEVHYHNCYQIVVSTKNTFDSVIEGVSYHNLKGFIIDRYIKHSCSAESGSFLVYYIETKSFLGKQLKNLLNTRDMIDIESILKPERLLQLKNDFSQENLTSSAIKTLSDQLLYDIFQLEISPVLSENLDSRIIKALDFINNNYNESITLEKVANHIFLSAERTRHLFLEQVEIPFSQYILWKRIKSVLTAVILNNSTLYEASIEFGFTDQSHFNRFFKRMFGISATIIIKNSRFVQFIYPEI